MADQGSLSSWEQHVLQVRSGALIRNYLLSATEPAQSSEETPQFVRISNGRHVNIGSPLNSGPLPQRSAQMSSIPFVGTTAQVGSMVPSVSAAPGQSRLGGFGRCYAKDEISFLEAWRDCFPGMVCLKELVEAFNTHFHDREPRSRPSLYAKYRSISNHASMPVNAGLRDQALQAWRDIVYPRWCTAQRVSFEHENSQQTGAVDEELQIPEDFEDADMEVAGILHRMQNHPTSAG